MNLTPGEIVVALRKGEFPAEKVKAPEKPVAKAIATTTVGAKKVATDSSELTALQDVCNRYGAALNASVPNVPEVPSQLQELFGQRVSTLRTKIHQVAGHANLALTFQTNLQEKLDKISETLAIIAEAEEKLATAKASLQAEISAAQVVSEKMTQVDLKTIEQSSAYVRECQQLKMTFEATMAAAVG